VEAHHNRSGPAQTAGEAVDRFRVHGAAVLRVGVANESGSDGVAVFGFFEDGFDSAGWSGDKEVFDFAGH
jgi:hypothetical protein